MDRTSAAGLLQGLGYNPRFVAAGMEGFVFDIEHSLLAKVWVKKSYTQVCQLRSFYHQLREKRLPFATPQIHDVLETTSAIVSTEERLAGVTLRNILDRHPHNNSFTKQGMLATVSVVEALRTAGDILAARQLALLGELSPWTTSATWNTVLSDLITLRVNKYHAILSRVVPDLEHIVSSVVPLLNHVQVPHIGVIHGDICPENILVDESTLAPIGLLDFGFLTTSGDPLFDAVLSTLIFDMYSPHMQHARKTLREMHAQHIGQAFEAIYPLYKAAYALITSNAYSENGADGHFQWCINILNDEETHKLVS